MSYIEYKGRVFIENYEKELGEDCPQNTYLVVYKNPLTNDVESDIIEAKNAKMAISSILINFAGMYCFPYFYSVQKLN